MLQVQVVQRHLRAAVKAGGKPEVGDQAPGRKRWGIGWAGDKQWDSTNGVLQPETASAARPCNSAPHCVCPLRPLAATPARLLRRQLALVHQCAGGEGADVGVIVVDAAHAQPVLNQLAQHIRLWIARWWGSSTGVMS